MKPRKIEAVVDKLKYTTEGAELLASDAFFDGRNWERQGRNTFLYRTKKGRYFIVKQTTIRGEWDKLEPLEEGDAMTLYSTLPTKEIPFESAFQGEVEEA
jgi:hypothetical protein